MKFDCGPTREEKRDALQTWHRHFAWRPKRFASHDCRWLEWIARKGQIHIVTGGDIFWTWEYREWL